MIEKDKDRRGRNKSFIVAGIKNLLKRNYRVRVEKVDVQSMVDSSLSFRENWYKIKRDLRKKGLLKKTWKTLKNSSMNS